MMKSLGTEIAEPSNRTLTKELAKLRKEIAEEESKLGVLEDAVETCSENLSCLHTEYASNVSSILSFYETRLLPFHEVVYAAEEQQSFIQMQINWIEKKIVEQEKCTRDGQFLETRDMRPAADELIKQARQQILRSYVAIQECPKNDLLIISNYECPPNESIETMQMVMQLRGDADCSWAASQVYMTVNYFRGFFVARSETLLKKYDLLPEDRMIALEAFCRKPSHDVKALYRSSTPIGCLGQWLRAVRDYYRVKLATAPVLLTDTSLEHMRGVREFLMFCTFGTHREKFEREVPDPVEALPLASAADAAPQHPSPGRTNMATEEEELTGGGRPEKTKLEQEAQDMIDAYRDTKNRLAQFLQPAVVSQVAVCRLRHYSNWIKENCREARESMEAIQREATGKLAELRRKYDGTMVPLESRLEKKVGDFMKVLNGEPLENSCS